jgi:hypothetical protein
MRYLLLLLLIPFNLYCGCEDGDCHNGYGTYVWRNGDTDDRSWAQGDKYVGYFVDGKMHGQGSYYSINGNIYTGSYVNGIQSGYGTIIYKSGEKYEGYILNDKRHGKGIFTNNKGVSKSVEYKYGNLLKK